MRAVVVDPVAQRLAVRDVPDPVPAAGQLLVRVRAAGLNGSDPLRLRGAHLSRIPGASAEPFIGGRELAGDVVAAAPDVIGWEMSDPIMGLGHGFADLAVVDAGQAMRVPSSITWEEAGSLPITLMTAHDALTRSARLCNGDAVLVIGGASGLGVITIQIAARLGARMIIATSRSRARLDTLAEHLGELPCPVVRVATDYADDAVCGAVRDVTHGAGADVVIDIVGGSAVGIAIEAAGFCARIVQVGRSAGRFVEVDTDELARKRLSLVGTTFRHRSAEELADVVAGAIHDLGPDLPGVRPRIARTFALEAAAEAYELLERSAHVGKLVLAPRAS